MSAQQSSTDYSVLESRFDSLNRDYSELKEEYTRVLAIGMTATIMLENILLDFVQGDIECDTPAARLKMLRIYEQSLAGNKHLVSHNGVDVSLEKV